MAAGGIFRVYMGAACLVALAACTDLPPPAETPPPAPQQSIRPPILTQDLIPSERSQNLARHYARMQASLLAQGLLRTDGGGPDAPYTDTDVMRNFKNIVFYDEYVRDRGFTAGDGAAVGLRKWTIPLRMAVEFGDSVPRSQRRSDTRMVADYAARLSQVSGHPITAGVDRDANFHVLFMGEDDRAQAVQHVQTLVPNIHASALDLFQRMPRSIHCLVVAFAENNDDHTYRRAIALIRAEHPDLLRKACVHEELAQGLGLANDSPQARPSIFNDDDEFALLTTQDEELLRLLYSPRLTPGMSFDEARPILTQLIAERRGGSS